MAAIANVQPQQPAVAALPAVARRSKALSIKVCRAVSLLFEVLARVSSIAILAAVLTGSLPISHVFLALMLSFTAKRTNVARQKLHDFENPQELQRIRSSAPHMSFSELKDSFNWADVKQYDLVPIQGVNGLKHKALLFLATPANFQDIKNMGKAQGVDSLLEHGIIDVEIAAAVRGGNQGRIQNLLAAYA